MTRGQEGMLQLEFLQEIFSKEGLGSADCWWRPSNFTDSLLVKNPTETLLMVDLGQEWI